MDDLDFSTPSPKPQAPAAVVKSESPPYDAKLAERFFRFAGQEQIIDAGERLFAEGDTTGGLFSKGARVYLLLEGQIALTLKGKPLHLILAGETFGEMALISDAPRSATATALKKSKLLVIDEKRFLAALPNEPDFALLLVGVLTAQMRRNVERLLTQKSGVITPRQNGTGLTPKQLAELAQALGNPKPTVMRAGDILVNQGALGVFMYVVTAGSIAIHVNQTLVEHIGVGESFGEQALLGSTPRAATATAVSDGHWLPVTRENFLRIVVSNPATGIALLRSVSARLQHLNAQMTN